MIMVIIMMMIIMCNYMIMIVNYKLLHKVEQNI